MPFPAICPTSPAVGIHPGGEATGINGSDAKIMRLPLAPASANGTFFKSTADRKQTHAQPPVRTPKRPNRRRMECFLKHPSSTLLPKVHC